jgi:hypothetical protein
VILTRIRRAEMRDSQPGPSRWIPRIVFMILGTLDLRRSAITGRGPGGRAGGRSTLTSPLSAQYPADECPGAATQSQGWSIKNPWAARLS